MARRAGARRRRLGSFDLGSLDPALRGRLARDAGPRSRRRRRTALPRCRLLLRSRRSVGERGGARECSAGVSRFSRRWAPSRPSSSSSLLPSHAPRRLASLGGRRGDHRGGDLRGAPNGGAFLFPYAFAALFALAGVREPRGIGIHLRGPDDAGGRRSALPLVSLLAKAEIGAAAARRPRGRASERGARDRPPQDNGALLVAFGLAAAAYVFAFRGIPIASLASEGPLVVFSPPAEWRQVYRLISGLDDPGGALSRFATALFLDVAILAGAWLVSRAAGSGERSPGSPRRCGGSFSPRRSFSAPRRSAATSRTSCHRSCRRRPWPPRSAALWLLRSTLEDRDGSRRSLFLLFAFTALAAVRVAGNVAYGFVTTPYTILALPGLAASASVLVLDVLAPRLARPLVFRRAAAAALLAVAARGLVRLERSRRMQTFAAVETAAGSLRLPEPWARASALALGFLDERAQPGDTLACFPECGFFNFVTASATRCGRSRSSRAISTRRRRPRSPCAFETPGRASSFSWTRRLRDGRRPGSGSITRERSPARSRRATFRRRRALARGRLSHTRARETARIESLRDRGVAAEDLHHALRLLTAPVLRRPSGRARRRDRRPPARHRLRDRLGRPARDGPRHSRRRRFPDPVSGREPRPDRRAHGRIRRNRVRDRRQLRRRRPDDLHDPRRRPAHDPGPRAFRGGDQVHPVPRRHGLYERYRGHHLLLADPGPARSPDGRGPGSVSREVGSVRLEPPDRLAGGHRRGGRIARILLVWPKVSRTVPAPIVAILVASVLVAALGLPVETIGSRFGEIRAAIPRAPPAVGVAGARPGALLAGGHRRAPGGDRVAALGRRRRRDDRQPPQVQRRARRAGSREHRVRSLRRNARHRRHRPHGHERQGGRPHSRRRHDARGGRGRRLPLSGEVGAVHPARDSRGDPRRRRVPHERVAHLRAALPDAEERRGRSA